MSLSLSSSPVKVELANASGRMLLLRDGVPYFVKGGGGDQYLDTLERCGGNSMRTWSESSTEGILDAANDLGLTVCAGIYIAHERHGFDYSDEVAVERQFQKIKSHIDAVKDHPAILMWGVGNEVELGYSNPSVWKAVEQVAAYIKKVDQNHPVMTTTAFVNKDVVSTILESCPSIDVLGVNAYEGLSAVSDALRASAWSKPYLVTEWGPSGTWEVQSTEWGAEIEPTSSEKAATRLERYSAIVEDSNCLGSYAFLWGQKQETTPTWFNLFLEDGSEEEGVEIMEYLWTGSYPTERAPRIGPLSFDGKRAEASVILEPREWVNVTFDILSSERLFSAKWGVALESEDKKEGGDVEIPPQEMAADVKTISCSKIKFQTPINPGNYRLYLYLIGSGIKVGTANFPFQVS